jgi:hypothetical protein
MLEIDLTGIIREELEPGEYVGQIVEVKQETSKKSGQPMLVVVVNVDGRLVWIRYSLAPTALWKLARDFTRLGLREKGSTKLAIDPQALIGLPVALRLTSRIRDGQERLEPEILGLAESGES